MFATFRVVKFARGENKDAVFMTDAFKVLIEEIPIIVPLTYKFPVNVPSALIILPAMTLPVVDRTLSVIVTFAGGVLDPWIVIMYGAGPLAMLSHIYCFNDILSLGLGLGPEEVDLHGCRRCR